MQAAPGSVRIVSYNVLSSELAPPSHFPSCDPENLRASSRLQKVQAKLEPEMERGAVLCLQELSIQWKGPLAVFCQERNYEFVTASYGNAFNGYMGVAVAWPRDAFRAVEVNVERIAETQSFHKKDRAPDSVAQRIGGVVNDWLPPAVSRFLQRSAGIDFRRPQDDWDQALRRNNHAVFVRLAPRAPGQGPGFCVATYHMPCAFRQPKVMTIHSALTAQWVHRRAHGMPYVLVGDFNLKPGDPGYQLITQGQLDPADAGFPTGRPFNPALETPLRSAYALASGGREPDFTNYAQVGKEDPFISTLDYIFLSPAWSVADVLHLPHRTEVNGPFPNAEEPSDHLMIAATLELSR